MPIYIVEVYGTVRELYSVVADTHAQAKAQWKDGDLISSEVDNREIDSVIEEYP